MNYNKKDHIHCFNQENSPCGIKGKHRCCLCNEPVLMNQILTQIQEEFDKDCPWLGSTYEQDAKNRKWVSDFLTQSNLRVIEKVKTRILSGMKPYTIKADKSVRVADLTTEQFESSVNSEEFWWEDESDLSTLIEQK